MCIDDFAFRKRYTYGTIMVDIETHQIIVLLSSREVNDVAEWIKSYPNIKVVSRDGSVSYHSAIKKANENIHQVSDHFHLLKGFTDAAKKFLTRFLAANFSLHPKVSHYNATSGKYNTTISSKIKPYAKDIKQLLSEGKSFAQIHIYVKKVIRVQNPQSYVKKVIRVQNPQSECMQQEKEN